MPVRISGCHLRDRFWRLFESMILALGLALTEWALCRLHDAVLPPWPSSSLLKGLQERRVPRAAGLGSRGGSAVAEQPSSGSGCPPWVGAAWGMRMQLSWAGAAACPRCLQGCGSPALPCWGSRTPPKGMLAALCCTFLSPGANLRSSCEQNESEEQEMGWEWKNLFALRLKMLEMQLVN